jgi:glutamate N-acetyltransferase/amino-acid N-acetyltransferase
VELPRGYRFAGVHAGVKRDSALDLALFVSDVPAAAVGVFTTNQVCAAPVHVCRRRLPSDQIRGIVVNSGNANACTGAQGERDAERLTALLAEKLACPVEAVLIGSTGVIGRPLPMDVLEPGVKAAYENLGAGQDAFENASRAILTTDTRTKVASRPLNLSGGAATIVGVAKGAAMIGPNMATMLVFLMTDAAAESTMLDATLRKAVDETFHCLSVEGHTSTNDTVLLLANGAAGVRIDDPRPLETAVVEICSELAQAIASDAEGVTHFVTIDVTGTRDDTEARRIAKAVADSPLVKTAIFGNDPNWGRICSAAGYAGVQFSEKDMSLRVNGSLLYDRGAPTKFDKAAEAARLRDSRNTHIELLFTLGSGKCRFWTSDLSYEYVRINAEYTT